MIFPQFDLGRLYTPKQIIPEVRASVKSPVMSEVHAVWSQVRTGVCLYARVCVFLCKWVGGVLLRPDLLSIYVYMYMYLCIYVHVYMYICTGRLCIWGGGEFLLRSDLLSNYIYVCTSI